MRLLIAFALLICIGFSKAFNPSHSVVIHGTRFALLDDSDPSLSTLSCQTSPITIPDSSSKWKIASPNNPVHRMAVASYPWGTSCLVLDGGVSLVTQRLEPCGENHLHESNDKYSVVGCDQKILMYNTEPVNLASELFKCSSFTTAEGNCDSWEDSSQTIEITSGTLTAHAAGDDTVTVTQSVSVSTEEASNLNTGFTFSITTSCLSDTASNLEHPLKYEAKVSISYKKGDVDKVLSFTENVCNGAWSTKEFSLLPVNKIKSISVTFSFKAAAPATVSWKDFTILSIDNLIDNPSFHGSGLNHFPEWKRIGLGYMPDLPRVDDDDDSFVSSIFMVTSQVDQYSYTLQGAAQSFHGDGWGENDNIRALYIGGWSKTYELTGTADDNFGIVADIEYEDGSCYGQALQFPTGTTNNWVYSDRVIQLDKPAVAVNITVLLRGHTGAVWLDGITFAIINPREQPISCNMGAFGDPRFKTIADEIYSFQTPGEYTLFTSSQDLIIQGRSVSFQQSQGSLLSAVAISGNSNTVSIQFDEATPAGWGNDTVLTDSPSIYVNGQRYTSPLPILIPNVGVITQRDYITYIPVVSGDFSDPDSSSSEAVSTVDSTGSSESSVLQVSSENSSSGSVPLIDDDDIIDKKMEQVFTKNSATYSFETSIQASVYSIKFPEGEIIVHSRYILDDDHDTTGEPPVKVAGYLQVVVSFVSSLCTGSDGLFGNGAKNALTSNTGNAIDVATASYQEIQQTAETWRVTTQNSLFHYDDADADEFYHPSSGPLKVNEDVQCVHWAVVSCDRQALTTLNDSCIEDILLMKNNPFIVQNYHTIEGQLHLVTSPVGEIIGNDNLGFLADDNAVNPGSGFTLTIIISVSILVIICAIGIIYRRRKRQAKRTIVATDLELEDMLSENEKVEMFE